MAKLGRLLAQRLNGSVGPTTVIVPTRGYSLIDVEGGPLWDREADLALVEALESDLRDEIPIERVDLAVNDPEFGRLVARRFIELAASGQAAEPGLAGGEEQ
jgi:uncharacterized protein (UPF0261 family)